MIAEVSHLVSCAMLALGSLYSDQLTANNNKCVDTGVIKTALTNFYSHRYIKMAGALDHFINNAQCAIIITVFSVFIEFQSDAMCRYVYV